MITNVTFDSIDFTQYEGNKESSFVLYKCGFILYLYNHLSMNKFL